MKPSVLLFVGDNAYSKDRAIQEIRSSLLDKESGDLDYKVFYGGEADEGSILDHVATVPFLSQKRLVVIKDFDKSSVNFQTRLFEYAKKALKSTYLILETGGEAGAGEYDSLAGSIIVKRFGNMTDSETVSWIRQYLTSAGKSIDPDAASTLNELQGRDLSLLSQEIEKLISFVGDKTKIETGDVEEVVGKSVSASLFDLAEYITNKKMDEAMKVAADLIANGKRHYEIIGLLCWHLKRILAAKLFKARGKQEAYISGVLKISRRRAGEFFKQAALLDIDKIRSQMEVLLEADLDIKRTKFDPSLILEFAIIRLCA